MDVGAYARQLKELLPQGALWRMEPGSNLSKLLTGLAQELARVDDRAADLVDEWDPRSALELLPDWERLLGFPDDLVPTIPSTVPERRINIVSRLVTRGGASRQYFIDLAASLGFVVTITEYTSDVARSGRLRSGDRIYGTAWAFAWTVNVSLASPALTGWVALSIFFRAGSGRAGDRLRSWNGPLLEAVLNLLKPAHTVVLFSYA